MSDKEPICVCLTLVASSVKICSFLVIILISTENLTGNAVIAVVRNGNVCIIGC